MNENIIRGTDGRYSAFGVYAGRPYVADGETLEEAQTERQVLKDTVAYRDMSRAIKYVSEQDKLLKWA